MLLFSIVAPLQLALYPSKMDCSPSIAVNSICNEMLNEGHLTKYVFSMKVSHSSDIHLNYYLGVLVSAIDSCMYSVFRRYITN